MPMQDQPAPHATSATRAGGSAESRACTSKEAQEGRTVLPRLPLAGITAEVAPLDPLPGAESLEQLGKRTGEPHHELDDGGEPARAVRIEEHLGVLRRQRVAPCRGLHGGIRLEHARHRLLLQPLPSIALVDAGGRGELGGSERTSIAKRAIEPEPVSQVDAAELYGVEGRLEKTLDESFSLRGQGIGAVHDPALSAASAARGRPRA